MVLAIATCLAGAEVLWAVQTNWRGYIVDRQCADSVREDSDPRSFIQHHTKDCALMPNCRAKGYSLYADGKWFDFDKRGNQLAIQLLQRSKRKSGFYVDVTGSAQGKVLRVENIKEIAEPKVDSQPGDKKNGTD